MCFNRQNWFQLRSTIARKLVGRFFIGVVSAVFLMQLAACGFVYDQHIIGPYRLIAVDGLEQMAICYTDGDSCIGSISNTVFSVGWNDKYIIAKQHPSNDKTITNYFIIEIMGNKNNNVIGPLSSTDFYEKIKTLGFDASFTKTIDSLE